MTHVHAKKSQRTLPRNMYKLTCTYTYTLYAQVLHVYVTYMISYMYT